MKARTGWVRAVGAALGAGALAWIAVAGGTTGGAGAADTAAMKAVAEDGPGYAIEDFAYPNADKVWPSRASPSSGVTVTSSWRTVRARRT
ncbi:hypothetical protein ACFYN3_15555 [Streptomyces lavendulae]|uniref:hypothetical protein n=1 Tax=Streptomyces lavendulae TaxID=1914 RepID=UPI0036B255A0